MIEKAKDMGDSMTEYDQDNHTSKHHPRGCWTLQELRAKRDEFRRLNEVAGRYRRAQDGDIDVAARIAGGLVGILAGCVAGAFYPGSYLWVIVGLGGAVGTYFAVMRTPAPSASDLDELLARYEAVSTEAYAELQSEYRSNRGFTMESLGKWFTQERMALELEQYAATPVPPAQFLNRQP